MNAPHSRGLALVRSIFRRRSKVVATGAISTQARRSRTPIVATTATGVHRPEAFAGTPRLGMSETNALPDAEAMRGTRSHLDFLRDIHALLSPSFYLEIGVRHGASLALATGHAVGVDPAPEIRVPLSDQAQVITATSDDFFAGRANELLTQPMDLAFVDGMHWFEFALRDFINIERRAHAATVIVFDDVFPAHRLQADRNRQTRVWTGDVWKIIPCLRRVRPDLLLIPIDTFPTGMLLVAGLNPDNHQLAEQYNAIVRELVDNDTGAVPKDVLERSGACAADDSRIAELLGMLRQHRDASASPVVPLALDAWRTELSR
jgi:predicted O-methyltransferase YrrM